METKQAMTNNLDRDKNIIRLKRFCREIGATDMLCIEAGEIRIVHKDHGESDTQTISLMNADFVFVAKWPADLEGLKGWRTISRQVEEHWANREYLRLTKETKVREKPMRIDES